MAFLFITVKSKVWVRFGQAHSITVAGTVVLGNLLFRYFFNCIIDKFINYSNVVE